MNAENLKRLTEVMSHWIRGAELGVERFAHLFFGRDAGDSRAALLHGAARGVSSATDHDGLTGAAERIAEALKDIGPDRWPGFVTDSRDRALDPATVAAIEESHRRGNDLTRPAYSREARWEDEKAPQPIPRPRSPGDLPVAGQPGQVSLPRRSGGGPDPRVRGLPPPDIQPPVRGPGRLTPGISSRPSESGIGGQSLWDEDGGEWRYHPADTWNGARWDYNEHAGPNSPWRTVPIGNPTSAKI